METSCPFELWDICGTSYAPFPLDEPKFKRRARGTTLLSWFGSRHILRSACRARHSYQGQISSVWPFLFGVGDLLASPNSSARKSIQASHSLATAMTARRRLP